MTCAFAQIYCYKKIEVWTEESTDTLKNIGEKDLLAETKDCEKMECKFVLLAFGFLLAMTCQQSSSGKWEKM